jgi:hypothetical protein
MEKIKIDIKQNDTVKKENTFVNRALSFIITSFDLIRSVLIRILFSIHITIAVSMVSFLKNDLWYLVNLVGVIFIGIEWFFCALKNGGQDQPWYG